jgi:hypothetical protein
MSMLEYTYKIIASSGNGRPDGVLRVIPRVHADFPGFGPGFCCGIRKMRYSPQFA